VWRRRLLAYEEDTVTECAAMLSDIVLQDTILDRWRWALDLIKGYFVRGTYQYLTSSNSSVERGISDMVWLKHVPLKVSMFIWRLLRNRLPTKDNLIRRMVLHQEDTAFVGGCGSSETAVHFILCVTSLAACGTSFISGFVFPSYPLTWLLIISITLVIWRVYRDILTLTSK